MSVMQIQLSIKYILCINYYFHDFFFQTNESTLCSEVFVNAPFFISAEDAGAMDAR